MCALHPTPGLHEQHWWKQATVSHETDGRKGVPTENASAGLPAAELAVITWLYPAAVAAMPSCRIMSRMSIASFTDADVDAQCRYAV